MASDPADVLQSVVVEEDKHVAQSHNDTSEGAVHCFQDEFGTSEGAVHCFQDEFGAR